MLRMKIIIVGLLLIFAAGCGKKETKSKPGDLTAYLPKEFPSIEMQRNPVVDTYEGQKLWEYIDGGAELYHLYNFKQVAATYYSGNGVEIGTDIYQFDTPVDAYGLYTMFRSPDVEVINMGVEGFLAPGMLNFVKGEYVVRLTGDDETVEVSNAITNLAEEINKILPGTTSKPGMFSIFPPEDRVALTDKYYADSFLGRKFLTQVYTQDYLIEGDSLTLFITDDKNGEKYLQWDELAKKSGKKESIDGDFSYDLNMAFIYEDNFYGKIIIGLRAGKLAGMVNYSAGREEMLSLWLTTIE